MTLEDALAQTAFTVSGELGRVAAQADVSLPLLRVLAILRDREHVRMADLADHMGVERSTMTGLVDRAAARGLVGRSRGGADGRSVEVALTPAARELASHYEEQVGRSLAGLVGRLTVAEQRRLEQLLVKMLGPTPE